MSLQLIDIIDYFLETGNINAAFEYQAYLVALVVLLIEYGHDPRNALATISKTFRHDTNQSIDGLRSESLLIATAHIIRSVAPFYLRDALDLLKVILATNENYFLLFLCHLKFKLNFIYFNPKVLLERKIVGNLILRNMILDSLIVRLAINGKNLHAQVAANIERHIKQVQKLKPSAEHIDAAKANVDECEESLKYVHPTIAMNANLARLSAKLCTDLKTSNTDTLERIVMHAQMNRELADQMHFFLRATLLSVEDHVPHELWVKLLELLLASVDTKSTVSGDTIYFMLYLLAKETDGQKQIELLRGLTKFATAKENIPLILNTYRSLSTSSKSILKIQSVDLYTRLWLVENRVYQFLHKALIADDETKFAVAYRWEMNIVKAQAIKTICLHK